MFKDKIIEWLNYINNLIIGIGQNGYLSSSLNGFNSTLYGYVSQVMDSVVKPVAYTILALFFVLELYKASIKIEGSGGGTSFGAEVIFKALFRMVLCKVAVDSTSLFMTAIYDVSLHLTNGVSGVIAGGSTSGGMNIAQMTNVVNSMGLGDQIGTFIELFIIKFIVQVIVKLVEVIVIARFIEIYVYVAIAPIPIATFPSDDLSSIGKNFLKSFAAVCIQGTLIYIVLSFFPVLFNSAILGEIGSMGITGALFSILGYSIVLALAVFSCGKWAKSICNAM